MSAAIIDGGNGADSIYINGSGGIYGIGTIAGGGNDTITMASQSLSAAAAGGLGTIYGGAGNDLITLASFSQIASVSGGAASTALSATTFGAVIDIDAGDEIRTFTSTTFSAGASTAVNWAGGAGTIYVGSTISGINAGLSALTAGSVGVYSNGTDTVIGIGNAATGASGVAQILIKGVDLVTTTAFGAVSMTSTAFGFSVSVNSGGGLDITLS